MAEYVFDNVDGSSGNIFLDSNQIFSTGDVVRVLGYYEVEMVGVCRYGSTLVLRLQHHTMHMSQLLTA